VFIIGVAAESQAMLEENGAKMAGGKAIVSVPSRRFFTAQKLASTID